MSRTLLISAGHGSGDPGAVGQGLTEADLALELRDMIAPKLEKLGYTVLRDGRQGENLPKETAFALAKKSQVAVEIHFNSTDPDATGVETFAAEDNRTFASRLSKVVATVLGLKLRGLAGYKSQFESQHGKKGLGFCKSGGVLVEICFMNKRDLARYLPRKEQICDAIVQAMSAQAGGTTEVVGLEGVAAGLVGGPMRGRKVSGGLSGTIGPASREASGTVTQRSRRNPQRRVPR